MKSWSVRRGPHLWAFLSSEWWLGSEYCQIDEILSGRRATLKFTMFPPFSLLNTTSSKAWSAVAPHCGHQPGEDCPGGWHPSCHRRLWALTSPGSPSLTSFTSVSRQGAGWVPLILGVVSLMDKVQSPLTWSTLSQTDEVSTEDLGRRETWSFYSWNSVCQWRSQACLQPARVMWDCIVYCDEAQRRELLLQL